MLKEFNAAAPAEFAAFQPRAVQVAQKRSNVNFWVNLGLTIGVGLLIGVGLHAFLRHTVTPKPPVVRQREK